MKKKYLIVIIVFLSSCITIDKPAQYITFNGKVSSINGSNLDGVEIRVDAMYAKYPFPFFINNCEDFKFAIECDTIKEKNKHKDIDYLNSLRKNIYNTKSDSSGLYKILINKNIYDKTYYKKNKPIYRYIRLVFNKEGFKTKIIPYIPECDSIFNELYSVKLESF